MSKKLRYEGGFYSVSKVLYDIQIWQEGYEGKPSAIAFCSAPLDIEWPERDKLEPIQSGHATLQLYSDTDRQFIDLYTIKAGTIRMDVYRNKALYWSGTLDPELYEEPFSYKEGYGVTLTFSDMAILDRLKWNRSGFMSMKALITYSMLQCDTQYTVIEEHVSTKLSQYSTANLLTEVSVQTENFYDEDGEPLTMREALEETLRPFTLRLIQKNGKIIIYDLNDIYTSLKPENLHWETDDATLGVDKVYNNIKVTFSPYEKTDLLKGTIEPDSVPGNGMLVRTDNALNQVGMESSPEGFRIALSTSGKGLLKSDKARFFRIDPAYSGQVEAGIAWSVTVTNSYGGDIHHLEKATHRIGDMLLKVPYMAYIADSGYYNKRDYKLKVSLQFLFDPRYNPFEQNNSTNWNHLKDWANYAFVPFLLTLKDAAGTALYHWENKEVKESSSFDHTNKCRWVAGPGVWGDAWLCWYEGNRKNETGLGGWQGNKQIIGHYSKGLPMLFDKMERGEYVDLPPTSGWLELQIGTGMPAYDNDKYDIVQGVYDQCRWMLYKDPEVTLVDKHSKSVKTKDIEHNAWINPDAKEDLSVDTIFGTLKSSSPTALGQLFLTTNKTAIKEFFRGGVTDLLERLLIGTAYSNYADRHNRLSGTVALHPGFAVYAGETEADRYLLVSETQHLREEESEITAVQFVADNYKGVEFKDETV